MLYAYQYSSGHSRSGHYTSEIEKETKHEYYALISQKWYWIVKNTSIEKLLYKKYKYKAELI